MGQYYTIVNLTKGQYLTPRSFGEGIKLLEFGSGKDGTLLALAILLTDGNGRGGGDLHSENPIIGAWAGDQIVIAGDYADDGKFLSDAQIKEYWAKVKPTEYETESLRYRNAPNVYDYAREFFQEVSDQVKKAMTDDPWLGYAPTEYSFGEDVEYIRKGEIDQALESLDVAKEIRWKKVKPDDLRWAQYNTEHKGREYHEAFKKWLLKKPMPKETKTEVKKWRYPDGALYWEKTENGMRLMRDGLVKASITKSTWRNGWYVKIGGNDISPYGGYATLTRAKKAAEAKVKGE